MIDQARCVLAYHMICDYEVDTEEDERLGKYNPISAGSIDASGMKRWLLDRSGLSESQINSVLQSSDPEDSWDNSPTNASDPQDWWDNSPTGDRTEETNYQSKPDEEDWWDN